MTDRTPETTKSDPINLLALLASVATGLTAAGGIVLYPMGNVAHRTYLAGWGLDTGLFPQAYDQTLMMGFYALFNRTVTLMSAMEGKTGTAVALFVLLTIYVFVWLQLPKKNARPAAWASRQPRWLINLISSILGSTFALTALPVAAALLMIVLALPAFFGEAYGEDLVRKHRAAFPESCNISATPSRSPCVELIREGQRIGLGRVIDSSESHIAIYDHASTSARALDRSGLELRVCRASGCDPTAAGP